MDLEAACIVCHWASGFWEWVAAGAAGAAGAAVASGGFSNATPGWTPGEIAGRAIRDAADAAYRSWYPPDGPPGYPDVEYVTGDGNPYWPGVSEVPPGRIIVSRSRSHEGPVDDNDPTVAEWVVSDDGYVVDVNFHRPEYDDPRWSEP
jgi:hypothetical protein